MREPAQSFTDILAWQHAHRLTLAVYELTNAFPRSEMYTLTSQLRRAAASVPANIAEGFRTRFTKEKVRYLSIAHSSLEETRYFLILAHDLSYADTTSHRKLLEETSRLLFRYRSAIERRVQQSSD